MSSNAGLVPSKNLIDKSFLNQTITTITTVAMIGLPFTVNNTLSFQKNITGSLLPKENITLKISSLELLKREFYISDDAEYFLDQHCDMSNILLETKKQIRRLFPTEKLSIEADLNSGYANEKLLLYIHTQLSVDDAEDKLDKLDDIWIIDNMEKLQNLIIDVRFP